MATRFLTAGQLCKYVGLPAPSLESLVREGTVKPAIPGDGRGVHRRYTASQALAISLSRWLRKEKQWPMRHAGNVLAAVLAMSDTAIERSLAEGRDTLLVVNGNALPWLTTLQTIQSSPELAAAREAGIAVDLETINLGRAWRKLTAQIDSLHKKQEVTV